MDMSKCICAAGHEVTPVPMMPKHADFAQWSVPTVQLSYPRTYTAERIPNPFPVTVTASAGMSAHFCAEPVLLRRLRLELDGQVVWSEDFKEKPVNVTRQLSLDTSKWTPGYHRLLAYAETTSGSEGYNSARDIYRDNSKLYVLVHHDAPQRAAPVISGAVAINRGETAPIVARAPRAAGGTDSIATGAVYNVKYGGQFGYNLTFLGHAPLVQAALQLQGYDGKWQPWNELNLAEAAKKVEGGWQYSLVSEIQIYKWYRKDEGGGLNWRFLARDCDGNETIIPFRWQYAP
jgi:hypothetical protein